MLTQIYFNHNPPKIILLSKLKLMIWLEVFEILALMMHQKVEIELLSNNPHCVNNILFVHQFLKA